MAAVLQVEHRRPSRKIQSSDWGSVWVSDGRLVSHTINEPDIKKSIEAARAKLRQDPAALKEYYVKRGMLTPSGKLSKRYGG